MNDLYNNALSGGNLGTYQFVVLKFHGTLTCDHEDSNDSPTLNSWAIPANNSYLLLGARTEIGFQGQTARARGNWAQVTLYDNSNTRPIVQNAIYAEEDTNRILDFFTPLYGYPAAGGNTLYLGGEIINAYTSGTITVEFTVNVYALKH